MCCLLTQVVEEIASKIHCELAQVKSSTVLQQQFLGTHGILTIQYSSQGLRACKLFEQIYTQDLLLSNKYQSVKLFSLNDKKK